MRVYRATEKFPVAERYGLTAQLRRAAVSAAANIAEGHERWGRKQFAYFLGVALGSLAEVDTLIDLAGEFGYLDAAARRDLEDILDEASRTTVGLLRRLDPHASTPSRLHA